MGPPTAGSDARSELPTDPTAPSGASVGRTSAATRICSHRTAPFASQCAAIACALEVRSCVLQKRPKRRPSAGRLDAKRPGDGRILEMLQIYCWNNWKDILRNQLCATVVRWPPAVAHSGAGDPTNPTPAEWAKFKDYVIWALKQRGIPDPEAWLDDRAKLDAKGVASAPANSGLRVRLATWRPTGNLPSASQSRSRTARRRPPPHCPGRRQR